MGFTARRFATLLPASVLALATAAGGCASQTVHPPPHRAVVQVRNKPPQHPGATIAAAQVGTPYRYGGTSPGGFDCSGLVYYAYRKAGIRVPRSTQAQLRHARHIALSQLQPGDLLFFKLDRRPVSHVGIYTGNGRFIHAPSNGKRVSFTTMDDPYWQAHFVAAGRY